MERVIFDTAAAVVAGVHACRVADGQRVTLKATGLAGVEEIKIMQQARATYAQASQDGTALALTVTNNSIQVIGPELVFFEKAITVGAVELKELSKNNT
jgi:hypothetical protein